MIVLADLHDRILPAYLTKAEEIQPGIQARMIAEVNSEVFDGLEDYSDHARLKRIASVIAAYRIAGAITTLIQTESGTENPFLYLQREYGLSLKELKDIREAYSLDETPMDHELDMLEVYTAQVTQFGNYEAYF